MSVNFMFSFYLFVSFYRAVLKTSFVRVCGLPMDRTTENPYGTRPQATPKCRIKIINKWLSNRFSTRVV